AVRTGGLGIGKGDSATLPRGTLPTSAPLAEWWTRHKSLIHKVLVSWSIRLCHVATGSYSWPTRCPTRTGAAGGQALSLHQGMAVAPAIRHPSFSVLAEHIGHLPQFNCTSRVRQTSFVSCSRCEPLPIWGEGHNVDMRHLQRCQPLARGNLPELN